MRMPTATEWSGAVTDREKLSAWLTPLACQVASGSPIRSIPPVRIRFSDPAASNDANLMLDDPPLIVRICKLARSMAGGPEHLVMLSFGDTLFHKPGAITFPVIILIVAGSLRRFVSL